jgi:hypothetical protein
LGPLPGALLFLLPITNIRQRDRHVGFMPQAGALFMDRISNKPPSETAAVLLAVSENRIDRDATFSSAPTADDTDLIGGAAGLGTGFIGCPASVSAPEVNSTWLATFRAR